MIFIVVVLVVVAVVVVVVAVVVVLLLLLLWSCCYRCCCNKEYLCDVQGSKFGHTVHNCKRKTTFLQLVGCCYCCCLQLLVSLLLFGTAVIAIVVSINSQIRNPIVLDPPL